LSGLATLRISKRRYPAIDILIVSGATKSSADLTVEALDGGAIDFIVKPKATNAQAGNDSLYKRLSPFIRYLAVRPERKPLVKKNRPLNWTDSFIDTSHGIRESNVQEILKNFRMEKDPGKSQIETTELPKDSRKTNLSPKMKMVVIGASTGSPGALASIIPKLPANFPVPIILIVHLPDSFSASFAKHLANKSQIRVTLANNDEMLLPSTVYLAKADKHLTVQFDSSFGPGMLPYRLVYLDTPPVNGICPSIDLMFESLSEAAATGCVGVIMTGMGKDGTKGLRMLKDIPGNYCIAQNPETCVVGSMPLSIINNNLADEVVDLENLASAIISVVYNE
jgi:two-component system chemotaxis response regulator CheB